MRDRERESEFIYRFFGKGYMLKNNSRVGFGRENEDWKLGCEGNYFLLFVYFFWNVFYVYIFKSYILGEKIGN